MQFPALIPGIFIKRPNRFTAGIKLEAGAIVEASVPTTGRLTGVLRPGGRVWLAQSDNPKRKTAYTLLLSELEHGGLCSVNAIMANHVFGEAVTLNQLGAFPYRTIAREVPIGHNRLDFCLSQDDARCWVEVKSVTYVADAVGMFPDAPTERGRHHLEVLAKLAAEGQRARAVFIAQRPDAERFAPFEAVDPAFAETLRRVQGSGVEVHAYRCDVRLEAITIAEEIPLNL
jgi:sugar fermentation stimulation protein A